MRPAFLTLKYIAVALLWFGIAYALCFLVGFTALQSLILAVIAVCAIHGSSLSQNLFEKQPAPFAPFWIRIEPNWSALSKDFGLPDMERCGVEASSEYSVLRDGVAFTVLSPTLFYSNNHQEFLGTLHISEVVTEMTPPEGDVGIHRPIAPRFYVNKSLAEPKKVPVIEFGLVTEESLKRSKHEWDDEEQMVVAQLPWIIFYWYYNFGVGLEEDRSVEARIKSDLTEFGWTQKERDCPHSWPWPYEVNHKYFRLFYRGIS
jgi:hypothetical protein